MRNAKEYIKFADPIVEAICVANWSSDGVGLTMADAAAVTNQQFGKTFKGNTQITSFDELEYFTGLTKIPDESFEGCTNLTTIKIPNVTQIGSFAFYACSGLSGTLVIPASVSDIGGRFAFAGCYGLTNFIVLANSIGDFSNDNSGDGIGNGNGLLYTKNFSSSRRYVKYQFKNVIFDGNVSLSAIDWHIQDSLIESIRISGDFSAPNNQTIYWSYGRPVNFFELGGADIARNLSVWSQYVYQRWNITSWLQWYCGDSCTTH